MSPDEIQPFMPATIQKWIRTGKCYVQSIPAEIQKVIRSRDGSAPTRLIVRDERTGRNSTWVNYWRRLDPRMHRDLPKRRMEVRRLIHMRGPGFEDMDNSGEGAGGPYGYAYGPHTPVGMASEHMKGVILCGRPSAAPIRTWGEPGVDIIDRDSHAVPFGASKLGPVGETFVSAGYPGYVLIVGRAVTAPGPRSPRDTLDPNRPSMRTITALRERWLDLWRAAGFTGADHLHVVLDDGNVGRKLVTDCLKEWRGRWCPTPGYRCAVDYDRKDIDDIYDVARRLADAVEAASTRQLRRSRRIPPRPHGHQAEQRR